jgi:hypothetical protein
LIILYKMPFIILNRIAPFTLIIIISIIILFKTSYNASNLDITPDSVEYALGGNSIATEGSYSITVNRTDYPPRYPPWFSLLVIAPNYIIIGNELGNAIYSITFYAVFGIAIAFLIGTNISGELGGILSALGLLLIHNYRSLGRQIMTDVPCVSLILLICYVYLILRRSPLINNLKLYSFAGILIGYCSALRPTCVSTILPFITIALFSKRVSTSLARLFCLLIPSLIVIGANIIYNYYTFNSIIRNGYNFWCPVPYDYLSLTFSFKYVLSNLRQLILSLNVILLTIAVILWFKSSHIICNNYKYTKVIYKHLMEFIIVGVGPLIVFHLFYFFSESRFYLPLTSILIVIVGSMLGIIFNNVYRRKYIVILFLVMLSAIAYRCIIYDTPPFKRKSIERILNNTPENSIIISSIDPAYLEYFICRKSSRLVVPISRSVEYASKLISYHIIKNPNPAPKNWKDHRCAGLIKGGAVEAIPYVAFERPDIIADKIKEGFPVFIDTSFLERSDKERIASLYEWFEFRKKDNQLYQLDIKR